MTDLEAAARRFASAYVATFDAPGTWLEAELELEAALHDLVLAAGEVCPMCDQCEGPLGADADLSPLELERPVLNTRPL